MKIKIFRKFNELIKEDINAEFSIAFLLLFATVFPIIIMQNFIADSNFRVFFVALHMVFLACYFYFVYHSKNPLLYLLTLIGMLIGLNLGVFDVSNLASSPQ